MQLPPFPWDSLAPYQARARAHPDGLIDLSVGTPVDPTPEFAQQALAQAADAHGYPQVWGTPELRLSIINYLARRWNAETNEKQILPVIGTKELVAWLPTTLSLGVEDTVVFPALAYPTYDVGARAVGARTLATDDPETALAARPKLIWINSPANPHGRILTATQTRAWITVARECGAVLAADECYGEFGWEAEPVSVLDPAVNDGSAAGLLAIHSLSKRSNAAGFRAGFVAGDETLVQAQLQIRKHLGMMLPTPTQAVMRALLDDDAHVLTQRERYASRRAVLRPALEAAGLRIDASEGSLYLWATQGKDCWETIGWLADLGILAAPGAFYTTTPESHVRIALTATDAQIEAAARRLTT
ncbi:MAG: succinyldiaminopimelate transaminase [Propionibacteriaceae bacterium]|jgi:succinyldiaminopimelate transaminase|nr:succinyldiaminopimelate transaminase [Propionibacteriaceae bacterium]